MKNKNKMPGVLAKTAQLFDIPGEVVAGMPLITMTGNSRLHIENHRGIIEYGEDLISVNGGKVIIIIHGDKLQLKAMSGEEMLVTGFITGIEFDV